MQTQWSWLNDSGEMSQQWTRCRNCKPCSWENYGLWINNLLLLLLLSHLARGSQQAIHSGQQLVFLSSEIETFPPPHTPPSSHLRQKKITFIHTHRNSNPSSTMYELREFKQVVQAHFIFFINNRDFVINAPIYMNPSQASCENQMR